MQIGCGGRGRTTWNRDCQREQENLVAIVDPDEKRLAKVKKWFQDKKHDTGKLQTFTDYRVMFDKMGKRLTLFSSPRPTITTPRPR